MWMTGTDQHSHTLVIGESFILGGDNIYLYPATANTGAFRSGSVVLVDTIGNSATISVSQAAPILFPTVTVMVHASQAWTITNQEGSVAEGMTTLYYEFMPHDNPLIYGTVRIFRNGVFDATGYFSMKDGMMTYESITVTEAENGDIYMVYLYAGIV